MAADSAELGMGAGNPWIIDNYLVVLPAADIDHRQP